MADNLTEAILYSFINDAGTPDAEIHNPYFISDTSPYSYFFIVAGDRFREFLSDSKGGTALVQFGIVRGNNVDACEDMESFIDFVKSNLYGTYTNIQIYKVSVVSERDVSTTEDMLEGVVHKQFDTEVLWRIA